MSGRISGRIRGTVQRTGNILKQAPLLVPVDRAGNGTQVSLVEAFDRWQKENLFLSVGSEILTPQPPRAFGAKRLAGGAEAKADESSRI
jgi:hypothetical protein